jgi:hypothetical protein
MFLRPGYLEQKKHQSHPKGGPEVVVRHLHRLLLQLSATAFLTEEWSL